MKNAMWSVPEKKARMLAKLSVAALIAVVSMALAPPAFASDVDPRFADSDGYVPVYEVCLPADPELGEIGGGYVPTDDGFGGVAGLIFVNVCALEELGAGPNDIEYVIAHEMGHARGLEHSDDPNDPMYPAYRITGT